MLSNAKLTKSFWVEVDSITCFLINWSPLIVVAKKTSIKVWSGTPAVYFDLKIFSCPAYARVDNGKLVPRYVKCIFIGYKNGVN